VLLCCCAAVCCVLYALCSMLYALCSMLYALCSLLSALCSLLSALCCLLSALSLLCATDAGTAGDADADQAEVMHRCCYLYPLVPMSVSALLSSVLCPLSSALSSGGGYCNAML
jgi:hypothetical protein